MHVRIKVSRWKKWTKYYVVIPKRIVRQLDLKKGERLRISLVGDKIVLERALGTQTRRSEKSY